MIYFSTNQELNLFETYFITVSFFCQNREENVKMVRLWLYIVTPSYNVTTMYLNDKNTLFSK